MAVKTKSVLLRSRSCCSSSCLRSSGIFRRCVESAGSSARLAVAGGRRFGVVQRRRPYRGEGPDFEGAGQTARLDAAQNCCATDECLEVRVRVSDQSIKLVESEGTRFARLMLWYANRVERVERNEHFCDCVVENSPHELNRHLFHGAISLARSARPVSAVIRLSAVWPAKGKRWLRNAPSYNARVELRRWVWDSNHVLAYSPKGRSPSRGSR